MFEKGITPQLLIKIISPRGIFFYRSDSYNPISKVHKVKLTPRMRYNNDNYNKTMTRSEICEKLTSFANLNGSITQYDYGELLKVEIGENALCLTTLTERVCFDDEKMIDYKVLTAIKSGYGGVAVDSINDDFWQETSVTIDGQFENSCGGSRKKFPVLEMIHQSFVKAYGTENYTIPFVRPPKKEEFSFANLWKSFVNLFS